VALPRILKPDESRLLWFFLKLGADALLLRGEGWAMRGGRAVLWCAQCKGVGVLCCARCKQHKHLSQPPAVMPAQPPTGAGCLQQLLELGGPGATVASISALSQWGTTTNTSSSSSSSSDSQPGGVTIPRLEGDFSLNAANVLAADLLLSSGLAKLCPTHDLNVSCGSNRSTGVS
jgi:hypothetical protein